MERTRRMPAYGESYTERLFETIGKNEGTAYVAELDDEIVGFIAGLIRTQSREDLHECIPSKDGRILELLVDAAHRTQGIGTMLMQKIEEYFRQKGCDVAGVEVFEPNVNAHQLYMKLGYRDRTVDMIKQL